MTAVITSISLIHLLFLDYPYSFSLLSICFAGELCHFCKHCSVCFYSATSGGAVIILYLSLPWKIKCISYEELLIKEDIFISYLYFKIVLKKFIYIKNFSRKLLPTSNNLTTNYQLVTSIYANHAKNVSLSKTFG